MDDSKIFSKTHEASEESFRKLKIFGAFGIKNQTKDRKFVVVVSILWIIVYPLISTIFGFTSIQNFGQLVEHTTSFMGTFEIVVRLINLTIWKTKIVKIAESFQELKKFDENGIVKKAEISTKRMLKVWLIGTYIMGFLFCSYQCFFNDKNIFLGFVRFSNEEPYRKIIGFFDIPVAMFLSNIWIYCQAILYLAYAQLTAHLKCLAVKFSKIEKPKTAGDSKENLEKLHEIIEIHQKLKRFKI
jgi:hypothetical protein